MPHAGRFDGFHAVPASVSKTYLTNLRYRAVSLAFRSLN